MFCFWCFFRRRHVGDIRPSETLTIALVRATSSDAVALNFLCTCFVLRKLKLVLHVRCNSKGIIITNIRTDSGRGGSGNNAGFCCYPPSWCFYLLQSTLGQYVFATAGARYLTKIAMGPDRMAAFQKSSTAPASWQGASKASV